MGAAATGIPLMPSGYIAGTVTLAVANQPYQLRLLIATQLDPNCPGGCQQVDLSTDTTDVYIGAPNLIGALSVSNYGIHLSPGSTDTSRASFPGNSAAVGSVWVMSPTAGATLHVVVNG